MARFRVRIEQNKVNDFHRSIEMAAKGLNKRKVEVGYVDGGDQERLALIHEYGCVIPVTSKMRHWFQAQGAPLRKSTTYITIPERSFIRAGFDKGFPEVWAMHSEMLGLGMVGEGDVETFLDSMGQDLTSQIADYAEDLRSPPNAEFTVRRKGASNPLIDTGDMIGSLSWRIT